MTINPSNLIEQTTCWTGQNPESFDNANIRYTIDEAKNSTEEIKDKVDANKNTKDNLNNLYLSTYEWYTKTLEELLNNITNIENEITTKWLTKSGKETMKQARNKLKSYKKNIQWKKKAIETAYQKNWKRDIYQDEINDIKIRKSDIDKIFDDIRRWQSGELSSTAPHNYNSIDTSKKSNKQQERLWEYEQKYMEEVKKWAILNIFNWQQEEAINFYKRIAEWNYTQADYATFIAYPQIFGPSFSSCGINAPSEILDNNTTPHNINYKNETRWNSFTKWWLSWLLDKALSCCNNLTPWQRNTRKSLSVLWIVWAAIYWWYKFITSKKLWWFRWKAWIVAWSFIVPEILIWENPISLFSKLLTWGLSIDEIKNKFWNAFWEISDSNNPEIQEIAPAMASLMIFDTSTKVWDIKELTNKFSTDQNYRNHFYKTTCQKLSKQSPKSVEYFQATFKENEFNQQKWNERLASFWVTDDTDNDILIYEIAENATLNRIIEEKFLAENWLKITSNKDQRAQYEQFKKKKQESNELISIEELNTNKNKRFQQNEKATYTDRPKDDRNRENLTQQVKNLGLNENKEKELIEAITLFYDSRNIGTKPNPESDFSLSMEENILVLTSHYGQKTKINLDTKTLCWFWNENWNNYEIPFSDLSELINSADLTNKILSITKWKPVKWKEIFQYKFLWWTASRKSISFNDAALLSWDTDTRIISTWRWWESNDFPTINKHLDKYADYLSKERINNNKINLESYSYIKNIWIDFTNKEEADQIENRLKDLAENKLSESQWCDGWNPFSISISWELKFKHIDNSEISCWNINNLTSITTNKEIFLKYINNPDNKIFWKNI